MKEDMSLRNLGAVAFHAAKVPTNVFSSILILSFNARLYTKRDNNVEGFVHAIKHRLFLVCMQNTCERQLYCLFR